MLEVLTAERLEVTRSAVRAGKVKVKEKQQRGLQQERKAKKVVVAKEDDDDIDDVCTVQGVSLKQ